MILISIIMSFVILAHRNAYERTAAVEDERAAEGSWDAEASVVLPLRFLGD